MEHWRLRRSVIFLCCGVSDEPILQREADIVPEIHLIVCAYLMFSMVESDTSSLES